MVIVKPVKKDIHWLNKETILFANKTVKGNASNVMGIPVPNAMLDLKFQMENAHQLIAALIVNFVLQELINQHQLQQEKHVQLVQQIALSVQIQPHA